MGENLRGVQKASVYWIKKYRKATREIIGRYQFFSEEEPSYKGRIKPGNRHIRLKSPIGR